MAKSLKKRLTEVMDLVAILGLTSATTYRIDMSMTPDKVAILLEPEAFVKVGRQLQVPRSKLTIHRTDYQDREYVHLEFTARGATFNACLSAEKVAEFYAELVDEPTKRLTQEAKRLTDVPTLFDSRPKRLALKGGVQ